MKVQIVESAAENALNPVQVGMTVEHEDGKKYRVTEILKHEMKANPKGQIISITWVDIEPI